MDTRSTEIWLTAADCARRMGLTVRALRLYERHGLVTPRRTDKQWRLYGVEEIARLNEVLALKELGLSLSRIASLLRGQPTDLARVLALQQEALAETRARADRALAMIDTVQATIAAGGAVTLDDLMTLAKETTMTDDSKNTMAWRRYEQNRPRTEVAIDKALYTDYAGSYRFEIGPFYIVTHRDGRLFTRVVGQADIEIFPEAVDRFFMKALAVQVVFVRSADGKVDHLVQHQGGEEHRANRVDPGEAQRADDELRERVQKKIAQPNSEAIIRRIIADHLRGEPDFDSMSPPLAALAHEQFETIQASLKQGGALTDLSFKGVTDDGWDVYAVQFENAKMEWGFVMAPNNKISGLYMRPAL
jgi:DNA-binding transcriptional MerR regulator